MADDRSAGPQTPRCPTCNHPQIAGVPCAVCGINEAVAPLLCERPLPSSPDSSPADTLSPNWTPTSVEEARERVLEWVHPNGSGPDDIARLIAAVRSATLREVREMVEGMGWYGSAYRAELLAGLAKLGGR